MEWLTFLKGTFEGFAPLLSAFLTAVIMWRILDQKQASQISGVETELRKFLTKELAEVRAELHLCEKARGEDQKIIASLENRVRELEWVNSRHHGEP